jgi:hypothetical protein
MGEELEARNGVALPEFMANSSPQKRFGYLTLGVQTTGSETERASRKAELDTATERLENVVNQSEKFASDNQAALRDLAIRNAEREDVPIVK